MKRKLRILISDHTKQGDRDYSDFVSDLTTKNLERMDIKKAFECAKERHEKQKEVI